MSKIVFFFKFEKKTCMFFLCIIFYQIKCVIFSYINFPFPQTSKCFLSNGINNMHIFASGPELQAVRFGYVILGENCGDWVYLYTIQSVISNFTIFKGIFDICFFLFYPSTNRCPSFQGIGKPPSSLWLNLCKKFTAQLKDLTDICMCGVQKLGSHSKIMLNTMTC